VTDAALHERDTLSAEKEALKGEVPYPQLLYSNNQLLMIVCGRCVTESKWCFMLRISLERWWCAGVLRARMVHSRCQLQGTVQTVSGAGWFAHGVGFTVDGMGQRRGGRQLLQGYLAHKKPRPPGTLHYHYA